MTVRVILYLRRRLAGREAGDGTDAHASEREKKIFLPVLAFPIMWLAVFVVLVIVASWQGSRDPVTKTVEVCVCARH